MFTKNFKNLMVLNLLNANGSGTNSSFPNDVSMNFYDIKGYLASCRSNSENAGSIASALSDTLKTTSGTTNSSWLVIGTGTGTVSENDYCLFNQDSNCACVSASSSTTGNLTKSYTATFQNNSESDVTITETGIVGNIYLNQAGYYIVLLEHTLLETPITIPAGGTRTITYVWSF